MKFTIPFVLVACAFLAFAGCGQTQEAASTKVTTKAMQEAMSPDDVLADLKAGNERFVGKRSTKQDWLAQAATTAKDGQFPKAIVLGCLDSRVPAEIIFDQGIGDIFVGRIAGNFEDVGLLGSMEFGTKLAGSKLIVVLGHTSCGAVKGAIARAELGNLTETLANIKPAIERAGEPGDDKAAYTQRVMIENVKQTVEDISARSTVISDLIKEGKLKVVGAWYDLATGKVNWL